VLSEHEWKVLGEVERQLLAEDPEFTRSFATHARRLQPARADHDLIKLAAVGAALLAALLLVAGSPGALAFAAVAGLLWWARAPIHEHRAARDDGPPISEPTTED
jgi:hypothetical protein